MRISHAQKTCIHHHHGHGPLNRHTDLAITVKSDSIRRQHTPKRHRIHRRRCHIEAFYRDDIRILGKAVAYLHDLE